MNYVKYVSSSMKKGCVQTLGTKTLIVGPNGSGKSTILQSIELATCGQVSDVEGRSQVKQLSALARLFPAGGPLESVVTLSDGTSFEWRAEEKEEGGYKLTSSVQPYTVRWPFQELKAILSGDASTVSSWLERHAGGNNGEADLLRALPPEVREDVASLSHQADSTDFMVLSKAAKDEARNLRTNATKMEKTIEKMLEGVAPPLLEEDRLALTAELEKCKGGNTAPAELERLKEKLADLLDEYLDLQEKQNKAFDPQAYSALIRLQQIQALHREHAELKSDTCLICGKGKAHDIATRAAELDSLGDALEEVSYQFERNRRMDDLLPQLMELADRIKTAIPFNESGQNIMQKLAADGAVQKTWQNAKDTRLVAAQMRYRADRLTAASTALTNVGKSILENRKAAFERVVSSYLPFSERFVVDLKNARVGILRGGNVHSALSGAEWSRVLLALASATENDSTPCVLAPEDRAWDSDTLQHVMEAVAASPVQIIIMSTVYPTKPVEGWQLVEVK